MAAGGAFGTSNYSAAIENPTKHFNSSRRFCGTVKFYKSQVGYGFFKVPNFRDVFFHIKDLRACGFNGTPQLGDSFFFGVEQQRRGAGFTPTYKAHSFEVDTHGQRTALHQRKNNCQSKGISGSLVAIPHPTDLQKQPQYEIASINGEIGLRNIHGNKKKVDTKMSRALDIAPNFVKIGPPCNVTHVRKVQAVVSATGPNSAEMAPLLESEEVQKLRDLVSKKKTTLRSLKLEKLPDGGRRLCDDIRAVESKLQNLIFKRDSGASSTQSREASHGEGKENVSPPPPTKLTAKGKPTSQCSFSSYPLLHCSSSTIESGKATTLKAPAVIRKNVQMKMKSSTTESLETNISREFLIQNALPGGQLYGGRMTTSRITEVRKVTKAAIEDLHNSLKTMPETSTELDDPAGLKISLMTHQRQALAWLSWREQQSMSGGILADDMGLGKTLTMISLILKQRESENVSERALRQEDDIQQFNSSTESLDSHVAPVVEDQKKDKPSSLNFEQLENGKDKSFLVGSGSTLIVAPASLLFHWRNEIFNKCEKGLLSVHLFHGASREKDAVRLAEFDVVITTYDIVRGCGTSKAESKQDTTLMQINWRRVILDEAHQIKNYKSQSSEAVCKLKATTRWAMSGTPIQNNLTDMYAMLKFLHCRPFDEYKVWKRQVDNAAQNGKERLEMLISCIVLRREKNNVTPSGKPLIDLPSRTVITHKLELNEVEREVYSKLELNSKAAYKKFQENKRGNALRPNPAHSDTPRASDSPVTATTLLVMLLRLRQCCGHLNLLRKSFDPELLCNEKKELALEDMFQSMGINGTPVELAGIDMNDYVGHDKAKYFEKHSVSGKVEFVLDELNKLRIEKPEDKCVIVSQWTSMLEVVAHHLNKAKISYVIIKGSVSAKKRMDMVDEFNRNPSSPMVILLSLQAGGVGLNLIGGNHLYVLDMHWNPALESQASDRIYRVGQNKPVHVHKFVVLGTVEEKILKLQQHKLELAKAVMQGAKSENCKKLTLQDMKLLFGL